MAVGRRQTNSNTRYDPNQDFTQDQLRRFGHVANQAQSNRDLENKLAQERQQSQRKSRALTPIVKIGDVKKEKSLRYAIWLTVALIVLLWFMYMTG